MGKQYLFLLTLLQAFVTAHAVTCEGNASNSCNGMVNTCTSEGLCVVNTSNGNCCLLSPPYGSNGCVSNQNALACESQLGETNVVVDDLAATADDMTNDSSAVAVDSLPAPSPTATQAQPTTLSVVDSPSVTSTDSSAAPSPIEPCYHVEIGLIFDEFPEETRWEITEGKRNSIQNADAVIVKESPFYDPDQDYVEASETHVVCIPSGRYTFTIMDRNSDGMCCDNGEGRYAVTYRETGEIITHGAAFDQFESVSFVVPFVAPPLRDADGDGVEDRTKNIFPEMILTDDGSPLPTCPNEFGLHLETDDYGIETTWELRKRSTTENYEDGKVVASGGPYTSDFTYDVSYCLYPGSYTFVFLDWQCDGLIGNKLTGSYTLKVNGQNVHTGGTSMDNYWEEVKLEFKNEINTNGGMSLSNRMMVGVSWMCGFVIMSAAFVW
ncbi:hypothetical protein ACHAW5_003511 [Stephanodiscus triporus]|uniref:Uncharacterized protein n=1 Tax=Stephanodiscus triporus TaxID=2934178 RepID=A0ABD3QHR1_9STRA